MGKLKIIECPRDAMQGLHDFIPTATKIDYINGLLDCGFDTIDFGSFVSPKAIPQLKDTAEVLEGLNPSDSKLLAIIANERGANDAVQFERIKYLGYPFSVSEEFQKRNTNATIEESFSRVEAICNLAAKNDKEMVLYLSMGFGNPYGDEWHPDIVAAWSEKLHEKLDVNILALSDTIGAATPEIVSDLFSTLIPALPNVEFGGHLHTLPENAHSLIEAAYTAGCRRFDGAIKGFGGCPMAADDLTGNMPTELMKLWFDVNAIETGLNTEKFEASISKALSVFP
ncbi:MAG: hydroxymethylglutaryl-CoA lyase [Crocinitomicaceae bacterium]|jgi:hydroxymethylglutaryl-CoA lyase